MTTKNRASYLDASLYHMQYQNYDLKNIEICIADEDSTDNILEIIDKYYKKFHQIKYYIINRKNDEKDKVRYNFAAESNSLIMNVTSFEKVALSHPEILFVNKDHLNYINEELNDEDMLLWHPSYIANDKYQYPYQENLGDLKTMSRNPSNGWFLCFNKNAFMDIGGIEEGYDPIVGHNTNVFITAFKKLKKEKQSRYDVFHLWHPRRQNPESTNKSELVRKVGEEVVKNKMIANTNNPNWKHPELVSDIKIFKE